MTTKNRVIKATPNYSKKTFTIHTIHPDKTVIKYRTIKMRKEEFNSALNWTQQDWIQFLKSDEYYLV